MMHYRRAIFAEFGERSGSGLTIFSAGGCSRAAEDGDLTTPYRSTRARTYRLGPLWFVPRALREAFGPSQVLVLSWNVRQIEILPVLIIGRMRGVRVILWGHGMGRATPGSPTSLLRRTEARLADAVLTYGAGGQHQVLSACPKARVEVLPNTTGRPVHHLPPVSDEAKFAVAFVGSVEPRKRVDRLLESLAIVRETGLTLDLHIVGSGTKEEELRSLAKKLDVDSQVHWHGDVLDWDLVRGVLQRCDLLIVPQHAGLAVVDGFAAGLGVVVADDASLNPPEAEHVLHRSTGMRYAPATSSGLADCLISAYEHPTLLSEMGRSAAEVYRRELSLQAAGDSFSRVVLRHPVGLGAT